MLDFILKDGKRLTLAYREAVDDYIEFKKEIGKDLVCISK